LCIIIVKQKQKEGRRKEGREGRREERKGRKEDGGRKRGRNLIFNKWKYK
jgi:hypothetical protein